ncbi:MAG TPA: hypothetical protein VJY41_08315 [Prolixibacteraceae bacterium]|nr:hypothetical protein [Prolixibacteraceae bacterium]
MENKKVTILKELISAVDEKNFDLAAWKTKTSLVLKNIFGDENEKSKRIDDLNYNFSSWTLRDHSGGKQHDPVKIQAKEIIEAALIELELEEDTNPTLSFFQDFLPGIKYNQLLEVIAQNDQNALSSFLADTDQNIKDQILLKLIRNQ